MEHGGARVVSNWDLRMTTNEEEYLHVRCPVGFKEKAKEAARICGESLTRFVIRAVQQAIDEANPKQWLVYRCKKDQRTAWQIVQARDFEEARSKAGELRGARGWRLEVVPQSDAFIDDWESVADSC